MLKFNERAANTVQNPESPDKVLFLNPDGVLQLKDSAGTLTNLVAENATGQSTARPFKVYKALLTQTGGTTPVVTVLENTLGETLTWTTSDTGKYSASYNVLNVNKVTINSGLANSGVESPTGFFTGYASLGDSFRIETYALDTSTPTLQDNVLNKTLIEINVYP